MIEKSNFGKLLDLLQFKDNGDGIWSRAFGDTVLKVDRTAERFLYKDAGVTVTGETTTNFSQKENFVVFECICRLLEKGYQPKHIELEHPWKLGHTAKSGRADIWIRTEDEQGGSDSLLIIECKTAGKEFDGAWEDTQNDGAQLFSYFQQAGSTKFLSLYTSDLVDGKIVNKYHLINVQDNADYLATLDKPKTFSAASTAIERFAVWRDTYKYDFATRGLFEEEIAPYNPGKNKYSTKDLREIDHESMQSKYHEFASILRKHNVSGHENAFDKLVNLFLAKVVDEKLNSKDLKFYWKGIAYDDAYSLQDRLQYLYTIGMREFLGETVVYIDEAEVKKAFGRFEKDPDATKDAVLNYFRQLKFYSNSDFSFIDVHNKRLFDENAAILLKVVRMLEDVKLKTDEPNQFLGDLFEGFLDRGVKQSEGQFFTPLPIVRFIISSLPIGDLLRDRDPKDPPRVIDYACGAGHFLNEYARQVKRIARDIYGDDAAGKQACCSEITGIEKEYRLSKVAKVAAFMYGDDDIRIVYADALAQNDKAPEGSFDVLVANPPYSVKGFLETLPEKEREHYELTGVVSKTNIAKQNSIETFFVERAVQLLKPAGIAAIILPSSIISNSGSIYVKCREIILKNFDIIAIAEFGSGTFGKTSTSTITAFLRKKDAPPNFADHWRNRADAWFAAKHDGDEVFGDASALERYCERRKFDFAEYKAFLAGKQQSPDEKYPGVWNSDAFRAYRAAFAKIKNPKDQEMDYIRKEEKERLYYFLLSDANPVDVLVVKMPAQTKAGKAFLGYEWRTRKGDEGIKYIGVALKDQAGDDGDEEDRGIGAEDTTLDRNKGIEGIKTPLFNNSDLFDREKLNSLIRSNFGDIGENSAEIPESLRPFAKYVPLADMLDFEASVFGKQLRTNTMEEIKIKSKYPIAKLGDVCTVVRGVTYKKEDQVSTDTDKVVLTADNVTLDGHFEISKTINLRSEIVLPPEKKLRKNDIFMCSSSGSRQHIGKSCMIEEDIDGYAGGFMVILRVRAGGSILPKFLHELLNTSVMRDVIRMSSHGANIQNLSNAIKELSVPLPPLEIQKDVVAACAKEDEAYAAARATIDEYRRKTADLFGRIKAGTPDGNCRKLEDLLVEVNGAKTKIAEDQIMESGEIPVITQRSDRLISGYTDDKEAAITDLPLVVFGDHTCVFKYVDFPFVRGADGTQLLKTDENVILSRFLHGYLGIVEIENAGKYERHFKYLKQVKIPVPPLDEQKKSVDTITGYEAEIAKAQAVMASVAARKQAILHEREIILAPSATPKP